MQILINDQKVYYEIYNENIEKTVFCVHGWGANIETLRPIINLLKKDYRVIAIDLPGHGKSEELKSVFSTEDFCNIIRLFIENLQLHNIVYLGHSFGGKCGIYLTGNNYDVINKLVLIDASGLRPKLSFAKKLSIYKFKFLKFLYSFFRGKDNLEKFYSKYGSEDYRNSSGFLRKTLVKVVNEDFENLLYNIDVKTQIIWGKYDLDTPLWMGERMNALIKNSDFTVLDGAHYSYLDDMLNFRRCLLKFLED